MSTRAKLLDKKLAAAATKHSIKPIETEADIHKVSAFLREINGIKRNGFVQSIECNLNLAPPSVKCRDIEVRESLIQGLGVFATATIPAKTVVTLYPAHGLLDLDTGKMVTDSPGIEIYRDTHSFVLPGNRYMLIGNRDRISEPNLLGHMINDAYGFPFKEGDGPTGLRNALARYMSTLDKNNCRPGMKDGNLVYIVTYRQIEPGEELLMAYGPGFWHNLTFNRPFPAELIDEKMHKYMVTQREKLEQIGFM